MIDPAQLDNALLNVCLNARDAMPQGGTLSIEAQQRTLDEAYCRLHAEVAPGSYVAISVSDTGTGIAPEDLPHVFEPFFSTKPDGKGTGLGLAMVYGFVKQSGGHVAIYSEPGLGTTVTVYLPVAAHAQAAARPEAGDGIEPAQGESVLVVEDNELVRVYAEQQLAALGYRVTVAASGAEALEVLRGPQPVDLLFTDVVMPGMSGPQLAAKARALRPGLPVLYASGYTQNAIVHHGRLDPGLHLVQKPYRRAELARRIRSALAAGEGGAE
jgi:CheY-like chemotaxis protein